VRERLASLISDLHLPDPTRLLNASADSGDRDLSDGMDAGLSEYYGEAHGVWEQAPAGDCDFENC
jgi:hypothetical protein